MTKRKQRRVLTPQSSSDEIIVLNKEEIKSEIEHKIEFPQIKGVSNLQKRNREEAKI